MNAMPSSGELNLPKPSHSSRPIPIMPVQLNSQQREEKQKLEDLVIKSKRVLFQISSVFPFDLFPDIVTIDENRVSIITKDLFQTEQILSIPIKYISNVTVQTVPFFASLKIFFGRSRSSNDEQGEESDEQSRMRSATITFLKQDEALKARRIIQGLMMASEQKIDFAKLETTDLISQLEELGSVAGEKT